MLVLLLACTASIPEDTEATGDTDEVADTDTTPRTDVDEDGSSPPEDCDDFNPARHPGATELWNGEDDDCDGRRDGDGTYAGEHTLDATAIFEGQSHSLHVVCPAVLVREGAHLDFTVTCTTDTNDPWEALLLGETLTITERDNIADDGGWSGALVFTSSSGWDADGTGSLAWDSFEGTWLTSRLRTVSLDANGAGNLVYQGL